ncbi:unnamed protein product [Orchesella dallaii]|uniref:Uncharacterized protein n=1 Tax=Orchesella dallaii TaxID=48710 RepID=A0ABP1PWB5_9HEXA
MSCDDHLMGSLKKYITKKQQTTLTLCSIQESEKVWINTMKEIKTSIIGINLEELELAEKGSQQVLRPLLTVCNTPGDINSSKRKQLNEICDKYEVMKEKWARFESRLQLVRETVERKETSWKIPVPKRKDFAEMTEVQREKLVDMWKDGEGVIYDLASTTERLKRQWTKLKPQLKEGIEDSAKRVSVITGEPIPLVKHTY